ncbi:2,3-epoxybenzoyl-CoA dihydrolase [soil metagenome]
MIDFRTTPEDYKHWTLEVEGDVAVLSLDVDEGGGLHEGYELKLNSYDLGVDIELRDAVDRLRISHPGVKVVILTSAHPEVFCAGANIRMLAGAAHSLKVNFCKLTNETRNAIEEATRESGQIYLAAVNGTASGGGYELALAADHLILVDDNNSAVSLPEVPLLGVLPGTGGLTRLVDKRMVRRDHADFLSTVAEGVKGQRAVDWRLVDELAPRSSFMEVARERAGELAERSDRPSDATGVDLPPVGRDIDDARLTYDHVTIDIDRDLAVARFVIRGPAEQPDDLSAIHMAGADWWPLALARQLDDAILHLRFNELEIGTWVFATEGDPAAVIAVDDALESHAKDWFVREVRLLLGRVLRRLDVTSRSLITMVEPGSCFVGTLAELVLVADRSFMLEGTFIDGPEDQQPAAIQLTQSNTGPYPMSNGLSRLRTRFWGRDDDLDTATAALGQALEAEDAVTNGLVTLAYDDIDWPDETRLALEERASLSPDALTGMEASLRFAGPETMETKIFGRLTAWQNWIFQRPNAAGEEGALGRYGTGLRPTFDRRRV